MLHDDQICAALPLTQLSIAAWYCHTHQAWCYMASVSTQTAGDELEVMAREEISLGPFDGLDALLLAVTEFAVANVPGAVASV